MNSIVNTVGGRKAAACLTGLVVLVGCFLYKGALPNELVDAVKYLVTTYLAGNIASDVVEGVNNTVQKKAEMQANAIPAEAVKYDDSLIIQRISTIEQAVGTQDQTLRQIVAALQSK